MNRTTILLLMSFSALLFLFSCQREISFEQGQLAKGSLQSDLGNCLPKTINGSYSVNTALIDSNFVDVTINVAQTGAYSIATDTVNGYSFKGTGNFTTTGPASIRLKGSGKPLIAQTDDFTLIFDTSFCSFQVTVLAGGSSGGSAVYTLQPGAGGTCMNSTVAGTYTQGTALTTANKVSIDVNVTTAGAWTITVPSVDGINFSGSGTFATTGAQTVQLTATGTPTNSGAQTFSVTAGSSTCSFVITVATSGGTPPPPTGDHFILTNNSWWSYNTPISASDTLRRTIVGSVTASGVTYKILKEKNATNLVDDSLYIRKSGTNYYELNYIDYYTSFYFDGVPVDSILFLKEGLTTGATWSSPEYTDAVSGVPTKVRYDFICDDANATVPLNGKTYSNVYKITLKVMVSKNGGAYAVDVTWINYYAQGIGWIYQKYDDGDPADTYELPIRFYQVF